MPQSLTGRIASVFAFIASLLCACKAEQARDPVTDMSSRSQPADSLVTTAENGAEIWFTLARTAQAPDGSVCVERGLEIRRGDTRIQVPLLYTGTAPVLLDDNRMRAELWNHCRPVDRYIVDLQSGRPVREQPGGSW